MICLLSVEIVRGAFGAKCFAEMIRTWGARRKIDLGQNDTYGFEGKLGATG
jgi:hypothetical protein